MNAREAALFFTLLLAGCGPEADRSGAGGTDDHDHAPVPTNRIDVPAAVRANLGIEFQVVGRRQVAATVRLPGHFELLPQGRVDHRMPLAGRIDVRVEPLARVAAGDLLFTIDSPEWRKTQQELADLSASIAVAETRLRSLEPLLVAHERHEQSLAEACAVLEARVQGLESVRAAVGGQAAELASARVQFAQMRAETTEATEKHTEAMALRAELTARLQTDRERFRLLLTSAQSHVGLSIDELSATNGEGRNRWQTLALVEVRARQPGVVATVEGHNGAWLAAGDPVLELVDPLRLRFVATALQSDLARLADGQPVRVVAPRHGTGSDAGLPTAAGTLVLGTHADPAQRTFDIAVRLAEVPAWARAGIAAYAEIETVSSGPGALAVPLAAVQQHGLSRVLFLRDPDDADAVIRIDADLGVSDGRWVEVKSGLADGDEVVVAGAYALVLASAPQQQGGHFHADGTWHADEDHK